MRSTFWGPWSSGFFAGIALSMAVVGAVAFALGLG